MENFAYLPIIIEKNSIFLIIMLFTLRFFGSTLLHAINTGISSFFLGKLKFGGSFSSFTIAFFSAVLLHSTFNLFLFGGLVGLVFEIILLLVFLIFLIKTMESNEAQFIRSTFLKKEGN
jgi:RsiW-degrading membrane proteinase PrsW (M82 family)